MSAPDPAYVRMYRSAMDRHRTQAAAHARRLADGVGILTRRMAEHPEHSHTDEARRLSGLAADLSAALAALEALREVEAITTGPDAGKV